MDTKFITILQEAVENRTYVRLTYHSPIGEFLFQNTLLKAIHYASLPYEIELTDGSRIPIPNIIAIGDVTANNGVVYDDFTCDC